MNLISRIKRNLIAQKIEAYLRAGNDSFIAYCPLFGHCGGNT
jgi:hypothetical protein